MLEQQSVIIDANDLVNHSALTSTQVKNQTIPLDSARMILGVGVKPYQIAIDREVGRRVLEVGPPGPLQLVESIAGRT